MIQQADRVRIQGRTGDKLNRFDKKKEAILHATSALFNQHGLRDATLAVIAAKIGLNLKSLRYYFERREDLVAAVYMRSIEVHRKMAQSALTEDGIEARVRRFVRDYLELLAAITRGDVPQFAYFGDLRALAEPQFAGVWAAYADMFRDIRLLFRTQEVVWDRARLNAATHMLLSQLLWTPVWAADFYPQDTPWMADAFTKTLLHGLSTSALRLPSSSEANVIVLETEDRLSQASFLRTAIALINQFGYRGALVDRISAELKVTKGSFYHHNETRDELVVACFEQTFARVRDAQDAAFRMEANGLAQLSFAAVSLVEQQMREKGTLLRTAALTCIGPELRTRMAHEMSRLTMRFEKMLNDAVNDGSAIPCNVRIAAEMTTAMVNSSEELTRWVKAANVDTAAELYVRPLLTGLLEYAGISAVERQGKLKPLNLRKHSA